MKKILVTPRSVTKDGHPAILALVRAGFDVVFSTAGRQPDEAELKSRLPGCSGYLAGVEKITSDVLEAATDLEVISRNGTGVDNIDLAAAERLGIKICRAEGANARGVAELAMGLIFSLIRDIPRSDSVIKSGGWDRRRGIELEGRTLGVIGCGKVGKLVAGMALGLGMKVAAFDLYRDASFCPSPDFRYASLEEVLAESDIVTLHAPPSPDGRALIDAVAIGRMKEGVYIVNTARAGLVDDAAMLAGIREGKISGLATDVFDSEPPEMSELLRSDRVIATPHIGGFTSESVDAAVTVAVENLLENLR